MPSSTRAGEQVTLPAGTRIPERDPADELRELWKELANCQGRIMAALVGAWWRHAAIWFACGLLMGGAGVACLLALAWSHLGGGHAVPLPTDRHMPARCPCHSGSAIRQALGA